MMSEGAEAERPSHVVSDSWRQLALATLAFGVAVSVVYMLWGWSGWLGLTIRLWVAYSIALLGIIALERGARAGPSARLPAMLATVTVGAALGSGVGLPLATDFLPERLSSVRWVAASVLLPFAFALMMIVPAIVLRWRSGIRLKQQLALSEHRRQVAAFAQQATLAQLQALQAQIEPHFLYNTLTSLEYLIRHDSRKAAQMLQHLHAYLRSALPNIRSGQSTVKTECELARAYLNIMRIRLGERLRFTVSMDPAVSAAELPPLMLGTLVENAITHGIEPAATGGHVWIEAAAKDGQLFVQVVDNGVGLSGVGSTGLGLSNLQARLRGLYGDAAKLSITQPADGGLCAEIRLPLRLATMAEGAPC